MYGKMPGVETYNPTGGNRLPYCPGTSLREHQRNSAHATRLVWGTLEMFLMLVRQMVVFYLAGDPKGLAGLLRDDAQHLYPAFQRTFQMLSMWIMSWDFYRTNQPFSFDQRDPHQAEEATAAQISGNTLDRIGAGPVAKQQHRPMKPRTNSFAPLYGDARVPGKAVGKAAPGGNEF